MVPEVDRVATIPVRACGVVLRTVSHSSTVSFVSA